MGASDIGDRSGDPIIPVPELRDYHQINAELIRRLDAGWRRVRLEGVDGQRLLIAGLSGSWEAVVEVEGNAGPELAAEMDSPGLVVVCQGDAADGAGRGLRQGKLLIMGHAGAGLGYGQRGGLLVAAQDAGARAGLLQEGGSLVILGRAGRLAGERQSGGRIFLRTHEVGPHAGHGRRGGFVISLQGQRSSPDLGGLDHEERLIVRTCLDLIENFASSN